MSFSCDNFVNKLINRLSGKCAQFFDHFFGYKFSVVEKDLFGPFDLVGDSLSRSMTAGEKLQIRNVIICGRFDPVMYGFFFGQFSSKMLLHNVAMFKNFASFDTILVREAKTDVALFGYLPLNLASFGRAFTFIRFQKNLSLKSAAARVATSQSATKTVTSHGEFGAAHLARFGFHACSALMGASARTIFRFLTPLFLVGSQAPDGERKGSLASFAMKLDGFCDIARATVFGQIRVVAISATKLVRFSRAQSCELFRAVDAVKYQTHVLLLSAGDLYVKTTLRATPNYIGAP